MKIYKQTLDLIPIPSFLICANNFDIILFNKKAKEFSEFNKFNFKNNKLTRFIKQDLLTEGEYNCSFKINNESLITVKLSVQTYHEKYLIVSFYELTGCSENFIDLKSKLPLNNTSDSNYKTLIDNSNDNILIIHNGIITYANPKSIKTSGYSLEELTGKKFTDFVAPKEYEKVNSYFQDTSTMLEAPIDYESLAKTKNNDYLEIEISATNIVFNQKLGYLVRLRDITKRKKAERKYRNIINFAPIGFYQSSRNGDFLITNNELANMLGFDSNEDLRSKNIADFYYSKEERERLIAKYDKTKKHNVKNIEVKFRKKDGSPIWVLMTSKAIKDKNNVTQYYDGFLIDINDKKEIEKGLLQKEYALASSINAIGITDLDGNMQYINNAAEKLWGYSKNEILGKHVVEFLDGKGIHKTLQELKEKGFSFGEDIGKRKDGTLFNLQYSASLVPDSDGKPASLFASFIDITDRKIHEQEIARLYKAIDQSPSPVALTDLNGKFIYVNPKYCELSGYTKQEFIGAHTRLLRSGTHNNLFYKKLWKTILAGKIWIGEITNRKKSGELFIESAKISPVFNDKGKATHYIKVSNDVTEEKRIKDELIKSKEKAEESDRLKSAFLANMSHEIRTPMNGILGFLDLLREPHLKDEEKEEYIKIINQSGTRMLNTLSDIVEISKIEAGIVEIKNVSVNINECINDILNFFEPQAQKKGLQIYFDKSNLNNEMNINTDIGKLQSILTNLIKNAIKYTKNGNITIDYQVQDSFIKFSIKDTGIGIAKYRQKAVFNRFEQADVDDKLVLEGSGLGLAITKSYVTILGGKIWLKSIEGEGSQFYFTIPILHESKSYHIKI